MSKTKEVPQETFAALLAEGQKLRKAFDRATAKMRYITEEDLKRR